MSETLIDPMTHKKKAKNGQSKQKATQTSKNENQISNNDKIKRFKPLQFIRMDSQGGLKTD